MPRNTNLLKASYKGAEFFVSSLTVDFGRRGVMHQAPFNDTPFFEDLGRKGRIFNVEAYVISGISETDQSYEARRDALMGAIENSTGAGTLVHPTMGSMRVVPINCSTTFNNTEGRIERLTITFAEEGSKTSAGIRNSVVAQQASNAYGGSSEGYTDVLALDYNTFGGVSGVVFSNTYTVEKYRGNPAVKDSFLRGIIKTLNKFFKKMNELSKASKTSGLSQFSKDFLELSATLQEAPQLITGYTTELFNTVKRITFGLSLAIVDPIDLFKANLSIFDLFFDDNGNNKALFDSVKGTSSDSQKYRARESELATTTLILSTAISQMAEATILATEQDSFTSVAEVTEYKNLLNNAFNKMALMIGDSDNPETYDDLLYLQSSLNSYLNEEAEKLPESKYIQVKRVKPALVIAYNQYDDSDRASELIERNIIANPNLVPVGDVEVLI